jgi:hypothetical protein
LTRRSGDLPIEGDERLLANWQAVLKPWNLTKSNGLSIAVNTSSNTNASTDTTANTAADTAVNTAAKAATEAIADTTADAAAEAAAEAVANAAANATADATADTATDAAADAAADATTDTSANTIADAATNDAAADADADTSVGQISAFLSEAYEMDTFPNWILGLLRKGAKHCKEVSLADCKEKDGRLIYRDCIYVPDHMPLRLQLLQDHHHPPAMGHPGRAKTLDLLTRKYYRPKMRKDVDHFVRNCNTCHRIKAIRHAPCGVLRPLSVPKRPWQHISVDFVTGLPPSKRYDAICVVVDRLTK